MADPKKVFLTDGKTVRWEIVYDAGRDPVTGKRRQITRRFPTRKEAVNELSRVGHERARGTYVPPSKLTVSELLDGYLKSAVFEREAGTASNYDHALRPARRFLGERLAQSVTRENAEALRDHMMTAGRRRGGKPGTGVGPRSVHLTFGRVIAAWDQAIDDGKVTSNPFRRVRLPRVPRSKKESYTEAEARQLLAAARDDRLFVAWLLALCGLRREEISGLTWANVDLEAGTLSIVIVRPVVNGKPIVKDAPKSERGRRTLPLLPGMAEALTVVRERQAFEARAAGEAYAASGYVITDELGAAVHPEWLSDQWLRVVKRAGLRRLTINEGRHTASTLLEHAGVPDSVRSAWCGHTVEVNRSTYVHSLPGDMAVARDSLAAIYGLGS
jgi:integrase